MTDLVWADPDSVRQYLDPNPSGPRETPLTLLHDHGFCARTCPSIHPPTRLYVMVLNAQVRLGFNASTRGAGYMYGEVREAHAHTASQLYWDMHWHKGHAVGVATCWPCLTRLTCQCTQ